MGSEEELPRPRGSARAKGQLCKNVWTSFTAASLCALFIFVCVIASRPAALYATPLDAAVVLRNSHGVEVHVLPTGACIHRLVLPDRHGALEDVVLGMATEASYADGSSPYFGVIAGRFANRIANATFTLDGARHTLRVNEKGFPGSLHGGTVGFDKVRWTAARVNLHALTHRRRGDAVRLTYESADGEEGYPGALSVELVYTLTDGHGLESESTGELIQTITATVGGRATVVNLAQHSYFNLAGHAAGGRGVLDHELTLHDATHYLPVDARRIPTGAFRAVRGTPHDFLAPRAIGAAIADVSGPGWAAGYDHCFVLHGFGNASDAEAAAAAGRGGGGGARSGGGGGGRAHGGSLHRLRGLAAQLARHAEVRGSREERGGGPPRPRADRAWWLAAPRRAATLHDPASGRAMEVSTNAPGLQLYTSNFLDGTLRGTKDGATYPKYAGVCLETQSFPDGPNRALAGLGGGDVLPEGSAYPTGILRPGEEYRHTTVYRFSARKSR